MTTIIAKLKDSTGANLVGYINITLESILSDLDTLYLPIVNRKTLVNGQVIFDLEPSDNAHVAYRFDIFQLGTPDTDPDPEVDNSTPDVLIKTFKALIPDSLTSINFKVLADQSGIKYDNQDSSLLTLSRYLYSNDTFWDVLGSRVLDNKGQWVVGSFYKKGDVVTYDGSGYQYVSPESTQGTLPTDVNRWRLLVSRGATGAGTSGNNTAYGAGWSGQTDAPTRNALFNIIQTLATQSQLGTYAPISGASLLNPTLNAGTTLAANDNSSKIVSSSWVQALVTLVSRAINPVGTINGFAGASAPNFWLLCDGRAISRTTYVDLFNIIGTTFGAGNGTTTFNIPDLRGRVLTGLDSMSALMGAASRIPGLTLGNGGGQATTTLTIPNMPSHDHGGSTGIVNGGTGTGSPVFLEGSGSGSASILQRNVTVLTTVNTFNNHTHGINPQGSGTAFSILPPYQGLNYIVYAGV
jgi:microcystin-dependent protein